MPNTKEQRSCSVHTHVVPAGPKKAAMSWGADISPYIRLVGKSRSQVHC